MLSRQNFSICDITEYHIMTSSDMNAERVRYLEISNRMTFKCKFVTEKEKEAQKQTE